MQNVHSGSPETYRGISKAKRKINKIQRKELSSNLKYNTPTIPKNHTLIIGNETNFLRLLTFKSS